MTKVKQDAIETTLDFEKIQVEDKYKIGRVLQMSSKPILSVGTYESLYAECIIAGSSDRNIRFLEINSLDEIARCKVTKKSEYGHEHGASAEEAVVLLGVHFASKNLLGWA